VRRLDRHQFARVTALAAGLTFPGEQLAALNAAEGVRKAAEVSWDQILSPPPPPAPPQQHELFWDPDSAVRFLRQHHHKLVSPAEIVFLRGIRGKRPLAPPQVRQFPVISHRVFLSSRMMDPDA
jgi:hypothetical protein